MKKLKMKRIEIEKKAVIYMKKTMKENAKNLNEIDEEKNMNEESH